MRRWLVRDVMSTPVVTVTESASFKDVIDVLEKHRISGVPVVDADGHVVGVISEADLICKIEYVGPDVRHRLIERRQQRVGRTKAEAGNAADLMSAPAVFIRPAATLTAAARLMDSESVKRLAVVDVAGKLVGIVSRRDLLRIYHRDDEGIRAEIVERVLGQTLWITPDRVTVTVDRGEVTLAGTVDRKSTIPIVVGLVQAVAGVVQVANHLTYHFADDRPL